MRDKESFTLLNEKFARIVKETNPKNNPKWVLTWVASNIFKNKNKIALAPNKQEVNIDKPLIFWNSVLSKNRNRGMKAKQAKIAKQIL